MSLAPQPDAADWPEAVVFDLDGTIADTAENIRQALNAALASDELAPLDVSTVKTMIGAGPEALVRRALRWLGNCSDVDIVERLTKKFHEAYRELGNSLSTLFDGGDTCLAALASRGIRMGICSNKPETFCRTLLADLGILDYFAAVQGSGTGLRHKPDPEPLLNTLRSLGVSPERALYVGDSQTDVLTARAAGVPVVLVSHGYTETPASELGADRVLATLADVPQLCTRAA